MYISTLLICAASLLVGRAIFVWLGEGKWTWLEPAVGLAALMTLGGIIGRIPEADWTAPILMGGLVIWALLALKRRYDLHDAVVPAAIAAVVALVVFTIPFVISSRWGLLGMGFNNDLGLHLAWSEYMRSGNGPEPWTGYPLGPHAIAVATATFPSTTLGQAFTGELLAIGILTAITAVGGLRGIGTGRRALAAVLVAASYLGVSYYAQGAFKETAEALFVLAFAMSLPRLRELWDPGPDRARIIVPAVLLLTGILCAYSFVGLAWPIAIAGLWALSVPEVRATLSPRRLWPKLRTRATLAWVGGFAAARRAARLRRAVRLRRRVRQHRGQQHLRAGVAGGGLRRLARGQLPAQRSRRGVDAGARGGDRHRGVPDRDRVVAAAGRARADAADCARGVHRPLPALDPGERRLLAGQGAGDHGAAGDAGDPARPARRRRPAGRAASGARAGSGAAG